MRKIISIVLIVSAISYVAAVITGGFLKENYSHIYNAISELHEAGSVKIFIVDILFKIYNYLLILYGVLMLFVYRKKINKKMTIVFTLLLLCGLSGILMEVFPQEAREQALTIKGIMHFVGAGIAAISTMLVTIITWINFKRDSGNKRYALYSIITFIIIFISGLGNVILINNGIGNFFGIVERITIGSFILWLFVTGILQYKNRFQYTI